MDCMFEFENLLKGIDERIDNYIKDEAVKQKLREAEEKNKPKRVKEDAEKMLKEIISLFQKAPIEQLSKCNFYVCVISQSHQMRYYTSEEHEIVEFECRPKYFDEALEKMLQLAETLKFDAKYENEGIYYIRYLR